MDGTRSGLGLCCSRPVCDARGSLCSGHSLGPSPQKAPLPAQSQERGQLSGASEVTGISTWRWDVLGQGKTWVGAWDPIALPAPWSPRGVGVLGADPTGPSRARHSPSQDTRSPAAGLAHPAGLPPLVCLVPLWLLHVSRLCGPLTVAAMCPQSHHGHRSSECWDRVYRSGHRAWLGPLSCHSGCECWAQGWTTPYIPPLHPPTSPGGRQSACFTHLEAQSVNDLPKIHS